MFGNLLRECGVLDSLAEAARTTLTNLITLLLGITISFSMQADSFVRPDTLLIMGIGLIAFVFDTLGGVLFATFINLFLLGYMVEFFQKMFFANMTDLNMVGQLVLFAAAFIVLCFSASLYITADLGVSTYDAVALILTNKFHLGKFKFVRITTDVICVAVGVSCYVLSCGTEGLETVVGVATIVTALCMGPFIDWFNRKLVEPFFYRDHERQGDA